MNLSSYTRELKKKKKEMLKRTKLKKLLEDTLEVLSDLKLNGKLTVVTYKEVSKLHNDLECMYKKLRKSTKTDHSTIV